MGGIAVDKGSWSFDLEANGLLDDSTIDYNSSPYKLKPEFKIHCAVFINMNTDEEVSFVGKDVYTKLKPWVLANCTHLIANNSISYDHMVMFLALDMPFVIGEDGIDFICDKPIRITDNMVVSKTLNPDRYSHSVEYFGNLFGFPKIDWRAEAIELGLIEANAPRGAEFATYHPNMLEYNKQDARLSKRIFFYLMEEWGDWDWTNSVILEHCIRDTITRQEHRGFAFNSKLAEQHVRALDKLMEDIRVIVEPVLPAKPMGKTKLKDYIPTAKQFLKSGEPNTHIKNFIAKHNGTLESRSDEWVATLYGKEYVLPMVHEPILTTEPATVRDTTHIKGWLVSMGWVPSQWKERDLTCDSKKKKLSQEKFIETVERYVEQTLESPFCELRCEEIGVYPKGLKAKLLKHDIKRPLKVPTNPTLTVGMEKEIDPKLLELADKFPHAKLVSEYLTYSHRRNSILGGGVDPDDDEEEAEKGYLSAVRSDGRIPTPADTCGAGTSRFKHRLVANIPRVTSLYGSQLRELFGVDTKLCYQLGYDFDGLEARIEGHYCYKYDNDLKEYCKSLIMEKPNDVHTLTAKKISEIIGEVFGRTPAKSVKYAASYGARPARIAKTVGCSLELGELIFEAFWQAAYPLAALAEKLKLYWETTGKKKFVLGIDGRKIPTRSASAIINSLFQSAGVICAKRAMIIHNRKLREAGYAVDFFTDDWKNLSYCQQLIAYHDEAQLEVTKDLVKWKMFDTEEDAKAFKKDHPTWSDVGHSAKGYYVGYCHAGELATQAVTEAGKYYKLNVELTAGYMLGTTWANCH